MSRVIKAIFRNGEVEPLEPLDLPENASLRIVIEDAEGNGRSSVGALNDDPLIKIYEIAEDIGPTDFATNLDHYLYGVSKVE